MENVQRYIGVVATVHQNHGFISLSTVTKLDGSEHDLSTKRDIFIHRANFGDRELKVGMTLSFEVKESDKSKKEYSLWADKVLFAGVELQFPEQVIDHPTVPVTWCFKSDVLEYIKACPEKTFGLIIGAVLPNDRYRRSSTRVLECHFGLEALGDGRSFISFRLPGEYQVYAYLVEYSDDEWTVQKAMKDIAAQDFDPTRPATGAVFTAGAADLPFLLRQQVEGKVVALSTFSLSVPDGIFAKPMTGWKKKWFCYFWDEDLLDDCDRRPKQWFAFLLGWPVYMVWEFLKRFFFFAIGLLALLLGLSPMCAWSESFSRQLSADWDSVRYGSTHDLTNYDGWREVFRPCWWVIAAGAWVYIPVAATKTLTVFPNALFYMGVIAGIVVPGAILGWGIYVLRDHFFSKTKEELKVKAKQRNERVWEKFETAVQCGAASAKKPVSVRLLAAEVKRLVCRNYKRS